MSNSELAKLTVKQLRELSQARGLPSYQVGGRRLGKADLIDQLLRADGHEPIDSAPPSSEPTSSEPTPESADPVLAPAPTNEPTTVAQFRRALAEHSILTEREVAGLLSTPAGWRVGNDLDAFVATLVRVGLLSEWQCAKILDGAADELRIDRYVLLAPLDEGGFGSVYIARHLLMDRIVALKVLRSGNGDYDRMLARFRREATASGKLDHPNLLRAHDLVQFGASAALVLEYVNGPNLHDLVFQNGPLPVPIACDCARQAAWGLDHTHKLGMVHRDIKPSNMLLASFPEGTRNNSWGTVKILDLGIVQWDDEESRNPISVAADDLRAPDDSSDVRSPRSQFGETSVIEQSASARLTDMGSVLGTAEYMAPEQAVDAQHVDHRADLYSLGATLFFLLTGQPPLSGDGNLWSMLYHLSEVAPPKLRELRPDCPAPLEALLDRLLSKDPNERPASASDVAVTLGEFIVPNAVVAAPCVDEPVDRGDSTVHSESDSSSRSLSTKGGWRLPHGSALSPFLACAVVVILLATWWIVVPNRDPRPDASSGVGVKDTVRSRDGGNSLQPGARGPHPADSAPSASGASARSEPVQHINRTVSQLE